jgi:hypothetical protein
MKLRKPSIYVVNWVSACLSFFLSASTAATYIFTAPNCTTTIINLEPCALNAEYQHFILSCSISYWDLLKCLYFVDTTETGDRGWNEAQRQGEDRVTLRITLLSRTTFYRLVGARGRRPLWSPPWVPMTFGRQCEVLEVLFFLIFYSLFGPCPARLALPPAPTCPENCPLPRPALSGRPFSVTPFSRTPFFPARARGCPCPAPLPGPAPCPPAPPCPVWPPVLGIRLVGPVPVFGIRPSGPVPPRH